MEKIQALKNYFQKEETVLLAFVFGSQAKGLARQSSDWDIAVYFNPREYLELEQEAGYPEENRIWSDLIRMLETDNVDFVVLNRARPDLVFTTLNSAVPLSIKDRRLYIELLSKTHYEAVDFWAFKSEFWEIGERSRSLIEEDKVRLLERIRFLPSKNHY